MLSFVNNFHMMIPKKVKIGAHTFQVLMVDDVDPEGNVGECCSEELTIKIKKTQKESQLAETLLHEIIHASDAHLTEAQVDRLGHVLLQVLRDNKLDFVS